MHHIAAFYESIDPGGALVPIAAVREEHIFVSGDDLRVPAGLTNVLGLAALINDASGVRAQLASPTLRSLANIDVEPIVLAAVFGSPPENLFHFDSGIPVAADEALNFNVNSNPAAAAAHYGLVFLGDGPQQPVSGQMFSLQATATVAQAVGTWTNGNLTFSQVLPAGRYQIIGMRARSTDGVAARLVFPDQTPRPGVPIVNAIGDLDPMSFRYGKAGVFGEFPHTNPPTVDVLGGVAAAQTFIFDMIRVA